MDGGKGFVKRDTESFFIGVEAAAKESRSLDHARNRSLHLPVETSVALVAFGRPNGFVLARDRFRREDPNPQGLAVAGLAVDRVPLRVPFVPSANQLEGSHCLLQPFFFLVHEASGVG